MRSPLVAVAVAALGIPAAAQAASVSVVPAPDYPGGIRNDFDDLHYVAAPGEANDLLVTFERASDDADPVITVRDSGAPVDPGAGCSAIDAHAARCKSVRGIGIFDSIAWLGDGDDRVHARPATPGGYDGWVIVFGGSGDDSLFGGTGSDELHGGGGHDRLFGGPNDDVIGDGDRSAVTGPAGPGADVMNGGAGRDTVSYAQRTRGVSVKLPADPAAGEPGEGDDVRAFEKATGGSGPDRLEGDDGPNELSGGAGPDLLIGHDGTDPGSAYGDALYGDRGRDRLQGGPGGDLMSPGPGLDSFSCGPGPELVYLPAARELIGACEEVEYDGLVPVQFDGFVDHQYRDLRFWPRPVAVTRKAAGFRIPCPRDDDGGSRSCFGELKVRQAFGRHRLLGRGTMPGRARVGGYTRVARVRLNKLGRRLVARRKGAVATMRLRGDAFPGPPAWTVKIRRTG